MINNTWITFVQEYRAKHKNLTYAQAMIAAKPDYEKMMGRKTKRTTKKTHKKKPKHGGNPAAAIAGAVQGVSDLATGLGGLIQTGMTQGGDYQRMRQEKQLEAYLAYKNMRNLGVLPASTTDAQLLDMARNG
jgi:hypothetical protein